MRWLELGERAPSPLYKYTYVFVCLHVNFYFSSIYLHCLLLTVLISRDYYYYYFAGENLIVICAILLLLFFCVFVELSYNHLVFISVFVYCGIFLAYRCLFALQ